ncbi:MAG TPA: ThiF family adenylyltransferase [Bacillota bacterium]|nr:ThiF family adenylyltransferase [Bacillota bacterium]
MKTIFDRTEMLLGTGTVSMIKKKKIIVFGVGGAGGFAAEALVRAGIQTITLVDSGTVDITDVNRQITALHSTVGRKKAEVMEERIRDINPEASVKARTENLGPENIETFSLKDYDYIVDAMDDVPAKVLLIKTADQMKIPALSVMETGNRFDPAQLLIDDVRKARACPMSKAVRNEAARMGVKSLKAVFSTEAPHREEEFADGGRAPSSISFVPSAAGILAASEVIRALLYMAPTEKAIFGFKISPKKPKSDY